MDSKQYVCYPVLSTSSYGPLITRSSSWLGAFNCSKSSPCPTFVDLAIGFVVVPRIKAIARQGVVEKCASYERSRPEACGKSSPCRRLSLLTYRLTAFAASVRRWLAIDVKLWDQRNHVASAQLDCETDVIVPRRCSPWKHSVFHVFLAARGRPIRSHWIRHDVHSSCNYLAHRLSHNAG